MKNSQLFFLVSQMFCIASILTVNDGHNLAFLLFGFLMLINGIMSIIHGKIEMDEKNETI